LELRQAKATIKGVFDRYPRLHYKVKSYEASQHEEERQWVDIIFDLGMPLDHLLGLLNEVATALGVNSPKKAFLWSTHEAKFAVGFPLRDVQEISDRFRYIG
jgi:hypothetical protein